MCLSIYNQKNKPVPEIAQADILVYKVMRVEDEGTPDAKVLSPYMDRVYEFDKVNPEVTMKPSRFGTSWDIEEGYHSFIDFESAKDELGSFHYDSFYMFVAVIPKGAKYFRGHFNNCNSKPPNSYASSSLILLHRRDPRSRSLIQNSIYNNDGVRVKVDYRA